MVLIILVTVLILAIAFFQVVQGLFSALVMTILSIICAAMAFNFYEPLAQVIASRQPAYAEAGALMAIFFVPLLTLRILYDRFLGGNVVLGVWADRVGGGALGLVAGMVIVGVMMTAVQMLPFDVGFLTFRPFDESLQRRQSLSPFRPDQFVVGLMRTTSSGALAGQTPLSQAHDDLLAELAAWRNRAGQNGDVNVMPDSLRVQGAYEVGPQQAAWLNELPAETAAGPAKLTKTLVIRTTVAQTAQGVNNWYYLPATHFRLVGTSGRSYYPRAYLTYEAKDGKRQTVQKEWKLHPATMQDGKAKVMELLVARPASSQLSIDWVYQLQAEDEPQYMVFRRISRASVPAAAKAAPVAAGALDRKAR